MPQLAHSCGRVNTHVFICGYVHADMSVCVFAYVDEELTTCVCVCVYVVCVFVCVCLCMWCVHGVCVYVSVCTMCVWCVCMVCVCGCLCVCVCRLEVLGKLQFIMQSQWNEAVSLLVSTPQRKVSFLLSSEKIEELSSWFLHFPGPLKTITVEQTLIKGKHS